MKILLKLEELAMFIASLFVLYVSHADWWWYLILVIAPDISMLGYLVNTKVGAWCYNLFHHKGIAILVFVIGWWCALILSHETAPLLGIALFGHSSMDRFFGFGLKTEEGFKFTHLGKIGKEEK